MWLPGEKQAEFRGEICVMILIALYVVFGFLLMTGAGLLITHRQARLHPFSPEGFTNLFWVGWASAIVFLQGWHLFFPVGAASLAVLGAASLAGWFMQGPRIWRWLRGYARLRIVTVGGLVLAFLALLINRVIRSDWAYDHGVYHMQTVKWISNFAIVPGLGNVHHRFAFNNSSFLYAAQLDAGFLHGFSFYVTGTLLAFVFGLRCLSALTRIIQNEPTLKMGRLYYVLAFPFLLYFIMNSSLAGYQADLIIFMLELLLAGELLMLFSAEETPVDQIPGRAAFIIFLSAVGITVKLSFAVFGGLAMLAVLAVVFSRRHAAPRANRPLLGGMAVVILAPILPWLVRHVILSGYLIYPSALISFPVQWRIPYDMVSPISGIITAWARKPDLFTPGMSLQEWFPEWLAGLHSKWTQALLFFILVMLVVGALAMFHKTKPAGWQGPVGLIAINLAALAYWFVTAPDLRFSGAVFWLLLVSAQLLLFQQLRQFRAFPSANLLATGMVLAVLLWLGPGLPVGISLRSFFRPLSEAQIAEMEAPDNIAEIRRTTSGLQVYLPADPNAELCWDNPLPCIRGADFDARLSLIDPQNMQKGFFIATSE
jgi:hypothetical protein